MANPIIRGFSNLTRFSGRDRRVQFWPYAAVVLVLAFVAIGIGMGAVIGEVFRDMQAFAAAHPEATTVHSSPGSYSISVDASHPEAPIPDLTGFSITLGGCVIGAILLLAAAVARRLHDSGRSALWGLLPVPFLLFGIGFFPVLTQSMMAAEEPDLGLFFLLFANNMIYIGALGILVVLLCLGTARGANRYGEEPAAD